MPIWGMDLNDQVGYARDPHGHWTRSLCEGIGEYGLGREHSAARRLRQTMSDHHLALMSSFVPIAYSFYGADGQRSKIDHLLMPMGALAARVDGSVPWKEQRELQLIGAREVREHVPQVFTLRAELRRQRRPASAPRLDDDAMMQCLMHGDRRGEFHKALEEELARRREQFEQATTGTTTNRMWVPIADALREASVRTFPAGSRLLDAQYAYLRLHREELLAERRKLRNSFEHSDEDMEGMVKLQLQLVSGRCRRLRQRAARRREVMLQEEMMHAWRGRRFAEFHRVRAMLAGMGRAPRKRLLWWPSQQSDRLEWQELLAKPGQEGGLLADEVSYADYEKQFVAERDDEADEAIPVQAVTIRQADDDECRMCWEPRRMAKRKAWPPWAFPIAALHMSMMPWRRAERARRAGLGADAAQTQGCPLFQEFMRKFLLRIRSLGWTPLAWHRSLAGALDKRGEKTGPRGMRLIHLFDAGGLV